MTPRMRTITTGERRARIATRHLVAASSRVGSIEEAARGVVCLHATDPATVYLSAWARTKKITIADVDRSLYDDRTLVRMLAMRRTMFMIPRDEVPIFHAAASRGVAVVERRRNEELVAQLGVKDVQGWMRRAERATLEAFDRLGSATASEVTKEVPALRRKVRMNVGKAYEADIGMGSRTLLLLATEGKVVRGRPRGTWISSQYRWSTVASWLGSEIVEMPVDEAQAEVVRRWLARFGPGTDTDIKWWTGWTLGAVRKALQAIDAEEVDVDGTRAFVLRGDTERTPKVEPWVALLPSLDPTTMGWRHREWYLGPHKDVLFDTVGNAGPTIWVDGRIVGGWAPRPDGEVVTKLLEDVGREAEAAVGAEAGRLTEWLQKARVVPRFPTPLYKELVET